jgi:hypothetical protein
VPRAHTKTSPLEPSCLFPDEKEIARLVLGSRASEWPVLVHAFEMDGLPKRDPLTGARYWPAVKAWFDARYGIATPASPVPLAPDGVEDWGAADRRRPRRKTVSTLRV